MGKLINKVKLTLTEERGDFVQNAIYLALVVIFGITVLTNFGKAIEAKFNSIIKTFSQVGGASATE